MERNLQLVDRVQKYLGPKELKHICYKRFNLTDESNIGRKGDIIWGKHFTAYALKYFFKEISLKKVALMLNLTNHATILHAIRKIDNQFQLETRLIHKHYKPYTIEWKKLLVAIDRVIVVLEKEQVAKIDLISQSIMTYDKLLS